MEESLNGYYLKGFSKEEQLGREKKAKGSFGKKPSRGNFGKKPSKGNFGKKPSGGSFGRNPSDGNFGKKPSGGNFGKRNTSISSSKKNPAHNKDKIKKSILINVAQMVFNRFVRLRDKNNGCISCGDTRISTEYHAGHYRSVGSSNSLRFTEDNCNKQCAYCNVFLSGNIKEYRKRLIRKIGLKRVEELEKRRVGSAFTIEDLVNIIEKYRKKGEKMSKRDFTVAEINKEIDETIKYGIEDSIRNGKIVTHKPCGCYEAIVSVNPEIRIDTWEKKVFGYSGDTLIFRSYE